MMEGNFMLAEKELEGILNTEELEITPEAEQYRYKKMLGEFYAKLNIYEPKYLYDKITKYHMDYIHDLLFIERTLETGEYKEVVAYLKEAILKREGYILQGRIFYNLQDIFEKHMYSTITEYVNPVTLKMKKMTKPSVFDYRLGGLDKEQIKKEFTNKLHSLNTAEMFESANTQDELNVFIKNIQ